MTNLVDAPAPTLPAPVVPPERAATGPSGRGRRPPVTVAGLSRRCRPLLRPAGYYLFSRVAVLGAAAVAAMAFPRLRIVQTLGSLWDGRWYLTIAQHGYPHHLFNEGNGSRWAFFPAFPIAIRAVAEVTRLSLPEAAVAAAFVFGLTSAIAVWLAVRELFGAKLADRAVLLYVFCPTAYVLSMAYTEGLFITAAAACLFALSRRYWLTAALCACVAGLTRNIGFVVVLAVLVAALPAAWRGRALRPAVAAVVAPLGLVSFMAYSWSVVGTPMAFLTSERFWHGQHFVWFTAPVKALLAALAPGAGPSRLPEAMAGAALVLGFVGLWLLDRMGRGPSHVAVLPLPDAGATGSNAAAPVARVPLHWWVYTGGAMLAAYGAYFTDSIARYTMAAFPLFAAFAWKLSARTEPVVVGVMACLQGALMAAVLVISVHPVHVPIVP